jgi:transposase
MGRVNTPIITELERLALENGLRTSKSHAFRMRCQTILLKSDGRKSKDVAGIVGMCHVSVNSWLKRYKDEGIQGLLTKPGRGRKPLIEQHRDTAAIIEAVKANRSRIVIAKAEWEAKRSGSSKPVSREAFTNFLKTLAHDINASEKE